MLTSEQENVLTNNIKAEMTKLRNESIKIGMRSVLGVVFDICNKDKSDKEKLDELKEFCSKGLNNG